MKARLGFLAALATLGCGIDVPSGVGGFDKPGAMSATSGPGDMDGDMDGGTDGSSGDAGSSTANADASTSAAGLSDGCNDPSCSTGGAGTSTAGADSSGGSVVPTGTDETGAAQGPASLPFDLEVDLGDAVLLLDAFALGGPLPAAIIDVTMDGGDWRLSELVSGAPFNVTQADCDHQGNHGQGRDRLTVTWQNDDTTQDSGEVDIRYCGN